MNYCKFLIVLLCTLPSATTQAQRKIVYGLGMSYSYHEQGHCKTLKVIDQRGEKDVVGTARTGTLSRRAILVPEKPFDVMVTSYYESIKKNHPADDELLLVLYHWEIYDNPIAGEIGGLYFDGDFFRGVNNTYTYLGTVDSVYEVAGDLDVTEKLMTLSRMQTSTLLTEYAVAEPQNDETHTTEEAVEKRRKIKSAYPIYNAVSFRKGIYYTVDDFLNHNAVDTPFTRDEVIPPTGGRKNMPAYYRNSKGKRGKYIDPDTYFAIYDGEQWSVSADGYGIPMKYENGEFTTTKQLTGLINRAYNAQMGAFGGGLIGAALANTGKNLQNQVLYKVKIDPVGKRYRKMKRLK